MAIIIVNSNPPDAEVHIDDGWCEGADIDRDGRVWMRDWLIFNQYFSPEYNCGIENGWCGGADIDRDGRVWMSDYLIFKQYFSPDYNCGKIYSLGPTNNSFEIDPGTWFLKVIKDGYKDYDEKFTIAQDETRIFDITLIKEGAPNWPLILGIGGVVLLGIGLIGLKKFK